MAILYDTTRLDILSRRRGSFFRVFTDSDGNSIIVDEDGDEYKVSNDADFSVFKPDNSENPRQYIEVDRTAKVGDRIRIVNAERTYGKYSNGDEFVVTKEPEFYGDVYVSEAETLGNAGGLIFRDEYVVLEPAGSKFSPGDDVILLSGGGSHPLHGFENGKIYKVLQTDYPHPLGTLIAISRTDGGHTGFARPDQLEKAEKVKSARPEVGSFVRFKKGVTTRYDDDDIFKISEDDGTEIPFKLERLGGDFAIWVAEHDVEPVSAEEVERTRKSQKWAEIGREVDEYKIGDIVAVTLNPGESILGEVKVANYMFIGVSHMDSTLRAVQKSNATLIAPVERRFDKME